jgi:mRNA interferase MazF
MTQRGDIVLVDYPFASGTGSKVRPALVIQCDVNNRRLSNTIVAQITTRIQHASAEPTQLLIEVNSPEGSSSGPLLDSAISCENLYTVRKDAIRRRIGKLNSTVMRRVNHCLKASLGID